MQRRCNGGGACCGGPVKGAAVGPGGAVKPEVADSLLDPFCVNDKFCISGNPVVAASAAMCSV